VTPIRDDVRLVMETIVHEHGRRAIERTAALLALSWVVHVGGDPYDGRTIDTLTCRVLDALEATR
jgi:hypothetical protein